MALLEEAIRVLAVPMRALTEALKVDEPADCALQRVAQSILDLGQSPADVCGVWAAETLLPASILKRASSKSPGDRNVAARPEEPGEGAGEEDVESHDQCTAVKIRQPPRYLTPGSSKVEEKAPSSDSESEDELPSPSTFIQSKPSAKTDNGVAKPGSRAGRPD